MMEGLDFCYVHLMKLLIGLKYKIAPEFWSCSQFCTAGDKKLKGKDNPWEMLCDIGT